MTPVAFRACRKLVRARRGDLVGDPPGEVAGLSTGPEIDACPLEHRPRCLDGEAVRSFGKPAVAQEFVDRGQIAKTHAAQCRAIHSCGYARLRAPGRASPEEGAKAGSAPVGAGSGRNRARLVAAVARGERLCDAAARPDAPEAGNRASEAGQEAGAGRAARRPQESAPHAGLRVTAPAAILIDARTGAVLWKKRPHMRRPIASTTKIMTAVVAMSRLRANDVVVVPKEATRVAPYKEGLHAGDRLPAWKLFYGLCSSPATTLPSRSRSRGRDEAAFHRTDEREGKSSRTPGHAVSEPQRADRRGNYSSAGISRR